jgi:hypothetical protein
LPPEQPRLPDPFAPSLSTGSGQALSKGASKQGLDKLSPNA